MNEFDTAISCLLTLAIELVISAFLCPLALVMVLLLQLSGIPLFIAGPVVVLLILGLGWAILRGLGRVKP